MPSPLYNKPFRLSKIFSGQDLDKQDIGSSISQYIELIIFTRYGEHRFKPDFGCEIWDLDFELIISESIWEEKLRQSLLRSITQYEKRIYDININVHIKEVNKFYPLRNVSEIKKKVEIVVSGKMQQTGENYVFTTSLFLSPLSA
ncbi:GPW/gp25 family protein [Mucilaginibacter robiniae]|uniref:GPW/gp25 family protein n=1 Tax=Mucilaginibacter robiniae TaxID=2728022 RepID=A0A7L5DZK5_9SPHI|nr:GPW/gp25 family protein [Mucilaginibacter robiniae]QJD96542.1 GPW/gp25 family protein [Mucilaginibacter robiniae]